MTNTTLDQDLARYRRTSLLLNVLTIAQYTAYALGALCLALTLLA